MTPLTPTAPLEVKEESSVNITSSKRPRRVISRPRYLVEVEPEETKRPRRKGKRGKRKEATVKSRKASKNASAFIDDNEAALRALVPPPPPPPPPLLKNPELALKVNSSSHSLVDPVFSGSVPVRTVPLEPGDWRQAIPHGNVEAHTVSGNPNVMGDNGQTVLNVELTIPGYGPYSLSVSFPRALAKPFVPDAGNGSAPVSVQCDRCKKWRELGPGIDPESLPDIWYCDMNYWDPKQASCGANEKKKLGVVSNRYHDDYCGICLMDLDKKDVKGKDLRIFHCAGNGKRTCLRSFHAHCIGAPEGLSALDFVCRACTLDTTKCFVCGKGRSPNGFLFQCGHHCGKFYHKKCFLKAWKDFAQDGPEAALKVDMKKMKTNFVCPMHYCRVCGSSGCGQKMMKCVACPKAFHSKCKTDPAVSSLYPPSGREGKKRMISRKGAFLCMEHNGVHELCIARTKQLKFRSGDVPGDVEASSKLFHWKETSTGKLLACNVCNSVDEEVGNYLVSCADCGVTVHQICYGITEFTKDAHEDSWKCAPCKELRDSGKERETIACAFCPIADFGAFKRTIIEDPAALVNPKRVRGRTSLARYG